MRRDELLLSEGELAELAAKVGIELGVELDTTRDISRVAYITDGVHTYSLEQHYPLPDTMVRIHRVYPRTHYGFADGEHPSARVTIARGPAAIAVEIRRRLAPGYDDVLARIADHDGGVELANGARGYLADKITRMFPPGKTHAPGHMQDDQRTELIVPGAAHQGGDVKFYGLGEEVEFDRFRVPAEVAVKMLAVYADYVATLDPNRDNTMITTNYSCRK